MKGNSLRRINRIFTAFTFAFMVIAFAGCGTKNATEVTKTETEQAKADESQKKDAVEEADVSVTEAVIENDETIKDEAEIEASEIDTALALYKEVLDKIDKDDLYVKRYNLIYLNDDDIPEMTLSAGYGDHDRVEIYSVIGGKLSKLYYESEYGKVDSFGGQGYIKYSEDNGIIEGGIYSGGVYETDVLSWDGSSDALNVVNVRNITYDSQKNYRKYQISDTEVGVIQYYSFAAECMKGNIFEIDYANSFDATEMALEDAFATVENERVANYVNRLKDTIGGTIKEEELLYTIHDFDGNGHKELFGIYDGDLWFVNEKKCMKLSPSDGMYSYVCYIDKFVAGSKAFAYVYTDKAVTDWLNDIWMVENGEPVLNEYSGRGCIAKPANPSVVGIFEMTTSAYDMMYSAMDDMTLGHTWKPYFFWMDNGDISECVSRELTVSEAASLMGDNIFDKIKASGLEAINAGEIENGMVVINFQKKESNGDISYNYIMWDENGGKGATGSYYGSDEKSADKWQEYLGDGTYYFNWR